MRKFCPRSILLIVFFVSFFISCNKEGDSPGQLEISLAKPGFQNAFVRLSPNATNYNISVKIDGHSDIKHNRTVSFRVDPSLLTAYNSSTGGHFELLPDSTFRIINANVQFIPGQSSVQLPVQIEINKINPYIKYVLPVKIESGDVAVSTLANTVLLRIVRTNDYSGLYADTITSVTTWNYGVNDHNYNFTDSVVYKILTAIDDSTVVMDCSLPGAVYYDNQLIIMHIRTDNSIWLSIYENDTNGIIIFGLANVYLRPYYRPVDEYFYIPYNYYNEAFNIKERLKKL